jgi:phage/plasmid-like protein (TIGR03299 family)
VSSLFEAGFCYQKPSWHGQETLLDHRPSLEEARLIAHNWEPVWEPLYRKTVRPMPDGTNYIEYHAVPDFSAVVRNDNNKMLHAANPATFGLFPNYGLYEIMEVFLGQGALLETNGSINEGKQVYVLAYLDEPYKVPGDTSLTYPFLAIMNAHDGSSRLRLLPTDIRVVCANTFHYASLQAEQTGVQYTFRHSASVKERVEEAKTALSQVRVNSQKYLEMAVELTGLTVDDDSLKEFLVDFLPSPEEHGEVISDRVRENIATARKAFKQIYLDSPTCEGIRGTGYGLFQAAGEYLDHKRGFRSRDSYLGRTVLSADRSKTKALELVRKVAR